MPHNGIHDLAIKGRDCREEDAPHHSDIPNLAATPLTFSVGLGVIIYHKLLCKPM